MSEKLIKYSCWCPEHAATVYSQFVPEDEGPITVCPLNESHTDISAVAIVKVDDHSIVRNKPVDSEGIDPDTALSCTDCHDFTVKAGQAMTEQTITYQYPVDIVAARYVVDDEQTGWQHGDKFDVYGIPPGDPNVDGVVAPVAQGETVIPVTGSFWSDQVGGKHGLFIKFVSHDDEYRIKSIDKDNNTIEILTGLAQAISPGDGIKMRRPFLTNGRVRKNILYPIGDLTSGSSELAAGAGLRIRYYPKTQPSSDFDLGFDLATLF
jgi:hypothetical protein